MKRFVFLILIFFFSKSQDFHFSQFYEAPLLLNPASAGSSKADFRIAANYRNQWKSIISPFKTVAFSLDSKVSFSSSRKNKSFFGFGLTLLNDKAGIPQLTTNQFQGVLAYHIPVSPTGYLTAGLSGGMFQRQINPIGLKWDRQFNGKNYDPTLPTGENMIFQNFMKFDLSAGLLYTYDNASKGVWFQAGGAMAHITRPRASFYGRRDFMNFKYTIHSHLQIRPEQQKVIYMPSLLFVRQGGHYEITAGSNFRFILGDETRENVILNTFNVLSSSFQLGIFYRFQDAIIFTTAFEFKKNLLLGISYDVNISRLIRASRFRGGPEFSLTFKLYRSEKFKNKSHDF
ncbi:MAG: PorP/SprF family type IX secretion system membrane protein [Bacteroidia bacterium]|nr:PorP/SprF family type IX secretion system membrane protein [Bacteroidia bacterium]